MNETLWYAKDKDAVFAAFRTSDDGLSPSEVALRLAKFGPNTLPETPPDPLWLIFARQFQSPLIYILAAACIVILIMGEYIDAASIAIVLVFNAIIGTVQEGRAQSTVASLKHFIETKATVIRSGIEETLRDDAVVPGDILVLREGDKVPADARLIAVENLTLDESAFTGESQPVYKTTDILMHAHLPVSDQKNMIWKGTHVVAGNGAGVAVATGVQTVIGGISAELSTIKSEDPIKKDIAKLTRYIIIASASIAGFIFVAGLVAGKGLEEMFTTVVSLSVSIIPEGLPVVLTVVLATGVWRMGKRNALVKKLQAVESLGQARVIAVDKTGTITKNELAIEAVYVDGNTYAIEATGYAPTGRVLLDGKTIEYHEYRELALHAGLPRMAEMAAMCAGAKVSFLEDKGIWQVAGDPTEAALLVFGEKLGFPKLAVEENNLKLGEIPFSYQTKYHAVLHKDKNASIITVVGAPESVIASCSTILIGGKAVHLKKEMRDAFDERIAYMSHRGLRVLAGAIKRSKLDSISGENIESLTLVGLFGMKDVLRPEVADALARSRAAGIKVVMITGDHRITAQAIAKEAGIFLPGTKVMTGDEVTALTDTELSKEIGDVSVFARVTPEHKMRIIEAYKRRGEVIAMTGDGVNDAPSLVAADLGVAMGKSGTEVAKAAADIILLDDNFGSIVSAIEEGRNIYKTIKKVILYLFSTGLGEVFAIAGSIFLGMPLPVLASQIIWLNFVTDGFLVIALSMEPKEKSLLSEHAAGKQAAFVDRSAIWRMIVMAVPMSIGSLWLFSQYMEGDMIKALTMSMTVLAVFQWFNAWNCRSDKESVFRMNPFSNMYLVYATVVVIGLQFFALYSPFMQKVLRTTGLSLHEWGMVILVACSIIVVEELRKWLFCGKSRTEKQAETAQKAV